MPPLGHGSITARFASPRRVLQVCSFPSDLNTEWEKHVKDLRSVHHRSRGRRSVVRGRVGVQPSYDRGAVQDWRLRVRVRCGGFRRRPCWRGLRGSPCGRYGRHPDGVARTDPSGCRSAGRAPRGGAPGSRGRAPDSGGRAPDSRGRAPDSGGCRAGGPDRRPGGRCCGRSGGRCCGRSGDCPAAGCSDPRHGRGQGCGNGWPCGRRPYIGSADPSGPGRRLKPTSSGFRPFRE